MTRSYHAPTGGHPPQDQLLTDRAVFTEAYAVIPRGVMRDIVTTHSLSEEDSYTEQDLERVKARLRSLGYL